MKTPNYYKHTNHEPRDVIREWNLNFNLGNVIKYIARAGKKGDKIEDLQKARDYINYEIEAIFEDVKDNE